MSTETTPPVVEPEEPVVELSGGVEVEPNAGEKTKQAEKTFTQAEMDAIIADRMKRQKAKLTEGQLSKEELDAYNTWKSNQVTAEEKAANERKELEARLQSAELEMTKLRRTELTRKAGILEEYVDFVAFTASNSVAEDVTFEDALETLLKESGDKWKIKKEETIADPASNLVTFGSGTKPGAAPPPNESDVLKAEYKKAKEAKDGSKMSAIMRKAHEKGINIHT